MTNRETSIITVRVDKEIKDELEKMSNKETTNLSNTVNRILKEHITWDRFKSDLKFVSFNQKITRELFLNLNSKKIEELSSVNSKSFEDACEYIHGKVDFNTFIETIDHWLVDSNFVFRHIMIENSDRYVINHEYGKNFSTFLLETFSQNVEKLGYKISDKIIGEIKLSFKIKKVE